MMTTVAMLLLFAVVDGEPRTSSAIFPTMEDCRKTAAETLALARANGQSVAGMCVLSPQFRSNERPA
jgi:hypothetical protein